MNGNDRAAAPHFAHHALPRLLNAALDGGGHGMAHRDRSGAGGDVDVEAGVRGQTQGHVSRAGADAPHVAG